MIVQRPTADQASVHYSFHCMCNLMNRYSREPNRVITVWNYSGPVYVGEYQNSTALMTVFRIRQPTVYWTALWRKVKRSEIVRELSSVLGQWRQACLSSAWARWQIIMDLLNNLLYKQHITPPDWSEVLPDWRYWLWSIYPVNQFLNRYLCSYTWCKRLLKSGLEFKSESMCSYSEQKWLKWLRKLG